MVNSTGRKERKTIRTQISRSNKFIFLFVLAALFVLATLCATVDDMRAVARPNLRVCLRDQASGVRRSCIRDRTHMLTYFELLRETYS